MSKFTTFYGQLGTIFSAKSDHFLDKLSPLCKDNSEHVLKTTRTIRDNSDQRQLGPSQLRPLLRQPSVHHLLKKCGAIYGPGC
jgi:hypothetical protein